MKVVDVLAFYLPLYLVAYLFFTVQPNQCRAHISNTINIIKFRASDSSEPKIPQRKPIRNFVFWRKTGRIYSAYKFAQAKRGLRQGLRLINPFKKGNETDIADKDKEAWSELHEKNSDRMLNLCLSLRGFYLKSGQFLATRHDFMPMQFCTKLTKLHDDIPPIGPEAIKTILEKELHGSVEDYFDEIDLSQPVGSASIAQVHFGVWKETGEKVAVKIQNPSAEKLMTGDLKNIVRLAEFLQKTELKFDLLSAVQELQKQIGNEFDFIREATNMEHVRTAIIKSVPEVRIPRAIYKTKKVLVMTFVEGDNLSKLAEYKNKNKGSTPSFIKKRAGRTLLDVLAKAWGTQIFDVRVFNADPHPGNICINTKGKGPKFGLLDWGQVKVVSDQLALDFAKVVVALHGRDAEKISHSFGNVGIVIADSSDKEVVAKIATSMLDTRVVPGYVMNPFDPDCIIKKNAVTKMPKDLYFVMRTVQMFRGMCAAFELDEYSLADKWLPYAKRTIEREHRKGLL